MSTIQIVGQTCQVCEQEIHVAMDAMYCEQCGISFHRNHDGGENCPRCGKLGEQDIPDAARMNRPAHIDQSILTRADWLWAILLPPVGVVMSVIFAYRRQPKCATMLMLSFSACFMWAFIGLAAAFCLFLYDLSRPWGFDFRLADYSE